MKTSEQHNISCFYNTAKNNISHMHSLETLSIQYDSEERQNLAL